MLLNDLTIIGETILLPKVGFIEVDITSTCREVVANNVFEFKIEANGIATAFERPSNTEKSEMSYINNTGLVQKVFRGKNLWIS